MSQNYDVQQVCENGHQITDGYEINPEKRKKFCEECGTATITECPSCSTKIQGATIGIGDDPRFRRIRDQRPYYIAPASVPSYCSNCGEAYSWTQKRIETAIQILTEFGNLDEAEKKTIEQDVKNIAKDVPQAELSARRIKRIWKKCGNAGYEVIMELASRTIANILKGP